MGSYYNLCFTGILLCLLKAFQGIFAGVTCPAHLSLLKNTHQAVYKSTCYLFVADERYWKHARNSCWSMGGEMLSIRDQETQDFITAKLSSKDLGWKREGVWLGARYQSGRWRWTDGDIMYYRNWARDQPSKILSLFSMEDCALMREDDNWKWHDYICGGLKFHYNYVCEFPAVVTSTATTTTTTTTTATVPSKRVKVKEVNTDVPKKVSSHIAFDSNQPLSDEPKTYNFQSDEPDSDLYHRLGKNVYRLMEEKGQSSKALLKLLLKKAMANDSEDSDNEDEQVTSRVSSSASNREKDNGYMNIVIIVASLSGGFLLIFGIIFLFMKRHNQVVKAKAAERTVRYHNHPPHSRAAETPALAPRDGDSNHQPPAIPTSRPPPVNDVYLQPIEVTNMSLESSHPNGILHNSNARHQNCNCSHTDNKMQGEISPSSSQNESDPELGACGGSEPDADLRRPLMSCQAASGSCNNRTESNCTATGQIPTESCSCAVSSHQGEYIAMNSLPSKGSCEKLNPEEKHTYSNVHMDLRENAAVENLYETLP